MNKGTILILVVLVSLLALFTSVATAQTGADTTVGQDGERTDLTGQSEVTIDVGAGPIGFKFDSADIRIDAGTTVRWVWTGRGSQHNVVQSEGTETVDDPMFESELTAEEGHEFTYTFEEPGTYDYVCSVHIAQNMIGSVEVVEENGDGGNVGRILTIENEPNSYTPGSEVSISGTAEGMDLIDIYVRDDGDYHYVTSIPTSGSGSYQSSLSLSEVADTSEARELLTTPGVYRLAVVDNDDSDTRTLTSSELHTSVTDQVALRVVEPADPANLQITDYEFRSSEVQAGETVRADATVRNVGDETASANVQYFLDLDIGRRSMEGISLQSGETESLQFTLTVPNNVDEGSYEQRISTGDDSVSSRLTVETEDPAYFEITDFELQDEAIVGEQVQAEASIQNTGDRRDSRTVRFYVDGNSEGRTSVSLSGGSTEVVDFSYTPDSVGDYEQEFRTGDDTIRRTITVREDDTDTEEEEPELEPAPGSLTDDPTQTTAGGSPNWEDRTFLPGGASVPIGDLNNPMTLTILGLILSIAGILIQMTSRF